VQNRDAFVTGAIEQFRPVMRKGRTTRDAMINHFRAQIFQPDVERSRMTLRIHSQWHRKVTAWGERPDRKLEPNQMLEVILRWRLEQIQEGQGRPSGT